VTLYCTDCGSEIEPTIEKVGEHLTLLDAVCNHCGGRGRFYFRSVDDDDDGIPERFTFCSRCQAIIPIKPKAKLPQFPVQCGSCRSAR